METGNKWFKFYGQDWLTDLKVMRLSMEDRLCFITLLCLASASSEQGVIRDCDEYSIIELSRIPEDTFHDVNPKENAKGFLERLEKLGMITQIVTERNAGVTDVIINAFEARQNTFMTNAERQAKYRERMKEKELKQGKSNEKVTRVTTEVTLEKKRIEKNRKEKNRKEEKKEETAVAVSVDKSTDEYLVSLNDVGFVMELFRRHYGVSPKPIMGGKTGRVDLSALAAARLVKTHGREKLRKMLEFILSYQNTDKYCRISTTPLDFEKNWSWYQTYIAQKKNEKDQKKPIKVYEEE